LNFAQLEGSCYCCGKKGHRSPQCTQKDKVAKKDWAINKTAEATFIQSASQTQTDSTPTVATTPSPPTTSTPPFGWMSVAIQLQLITNEMKNWVLLDTGSTVHVFCNKQLVKNIREANKELNVTTNAGTFQCTQMATLPW
jgi:hypothetical protein